MAEHDDGITARDEARAAGRDINEQCDQRDSRVSFNVNGDGNVIVGPNARYAVATPCPSCRIRFLIDAGEQACPECVWQHHKGMAGAMLIWALGCWLACMSLIVSVAKLFEVRVTFDFLMRAGFALELVLGMFAFWACLKGWSLSRFLSRWL